MLACSACQPIGSWGENEMARRRSLTSQLYRAARVSNNLGAVASGNPTRMARRTKNVAVGRTLGRAGFWRRFWG